MTTYHGLDKIPMDNKARRALGCGHGGIFTRPRGAGGRHIPKAVAYSESGSVCRGIALEPYDALRPCMTTREQAMKYYVAGGAVRDLLLGRLLRDADYAFDATEDAFIQRNPTARKTKSGPHPIFLLQGQEFSPLPTTHSLEEAIRLDLLRRDFTINALLLSQEGVLHFHADALRDLKCRKIRPASPSSLADDPVRAFRAARLVSCLSEFTLHEETLQCMRNLGESPLQHIAAEQIGSETIKACRGDAPGEFLRTLCAGECLKPWFVEFCGAAAKPAGPPAWHDVSVLEHTARIMDAVAADYARNTPEAAGNERALAVWMALCHDIGKTATPEEFLPSHHGHEREGETLALVLGTRLRLPSLFIRAGILASRHHMKAAQYARLRPGTRVDMLMSLHAAHLLKPFSRMAAVDANNPELPVCIERELAHVLSVKLPDTWRGRGEASGKRLRELRCQALTPGSSRPPADHIERDITAS